MFQKLEASVGDRVELLIFTSNLCHWVPGIVESYDPETEMYKLIFDINFIDPKIKYQMSKGFHVLNVRKKS